MTAAAAVTSHLEPQSLLTGDGRSSDYRDFVGGSKQEWAVDAEDRSIVGDILVLEYVHAAILDILVSDLRDGGGRGDTANEEQRGQNHSGFDGNGEVGEDGESEGDEPDADVGLRQFQQLRNLAPLSHVVGDDHQDSCERRHGYVAHEWRGEKKNAEQRERVDHAGDRRLRAGADAGGGASDGAGGGKSSEHGRHNISHALADEFDIGIVAVIAHAVRDYSGHERFDRTQHGNSKGRAEQAVNQVSAELGNCEMGQAAGDPSETRADGSYWKFEKINGCGA